MRQRQGWRVPFPWVMSLSTAYISIQLLIDTTNALQEIESRVTPRAFASVMDSTKGLAVRASRLSGGGAGRNQRRRCHLKGPAAEIPSPATPLSTKKGGPLAPKRPH
jgi:hypothetical protein